MFTRFLTLAALCLLAACGTKTTAATDTDAAVTDMTEADVAVDAAADATVVSPLSWPVGKAGPYVCGLRILQMTYKLPGSLGERTVPLYIWYPATQAVGDHPAYMGAFDDPKSWLNAPLGPSAYAAGYPLLVHSHGYEGFSGNSADLMCHIASHGWIALAPEHVGNTLIDTPPQLPLVHWIHRPMDIKAALDWAKTPPSGEVLAGKLDLAHVGMSGHSFGSYTVWGIAGAVYDAVKLAAECKNGQWPDCTPDLLAEFAKPLSDDRPLAFISLAGDGDSRMFSTWGRNAVNRPLLQMNGTLNDSGETQLFADVTGVDLTWVDITGGCHQLYGLGNSINGGPECKALGDEEGFALVRPWFLAWLRYHVLADRSAEVADIVTGKVAVSPLVAFQHKAPQP
jgi:predicted dienelactone hydrolase